MKTPTSIFTLILSLACGGFLTADIVRMKNGTELECEIVSENADSYTVSVNVTPTIRDERTIPKADVASVDRISPADAAFEAIASIIPTPDLQTVADYDRMINKQVIQFLESFPDSAHTKQVQAIQEGLKKERAMVEQGAIKLDQKWISPADRLANIYELDARIAYDKAEQTAEAGDLVTSLRTLDSIHSDYSGAEHYAKAVELSKKVLKFYKAKVTADFKRVDTLIEQRKVELTKIPTNQRDFALAEMKKKDTSYLNQLKRDKVAKLKWPRLNIYHKEPMVETIRAAESELRRLEGLDLSTIKPVGPVYSKAWAAAVGGNEDEAKQLFLDLKNLKVPESYITQLEAQLPEPEPATPTPPVGNEPTGAGEEPDGDAETEEGTDGEEGEEPATGKTKTEESESTQGDDASTSVTEEPAVQEEESGMTTILLVVIGVVIIIAVGAIFAGKKKSDD